MQFDDVYQLMVETRFYHKTLNTNFWKDGVFDPRVREKLLSIVWDFVCSDEQCPVVDDVQLTGSLANYNYTKFSDLDVHILIDFSNINKDVDLVKKAFDGKRFVWNTRHNIMIRGHEVELYYQDTNEPHIASGLYSLMDDKWIKKPKYNPPEVDERDVIKKSSTIADSIDRIHDITNKELSPTEAKKWYNVGKKLKNKIQTMRRSGLAKHGEFAIENLAFKELRNTGKIKTLIDTIATMYDKIYSENTTPVSEHMDTLSDIVFGKDKSKHNKLDPNTKFHLGHTMRGINRKTQKFISDVHRNDGSLNTKIETLKNRPGKLACDLSDVDRIVKDYVPDLKTNPPTKENPKQLNRTKINVYYDSSKNIFYLEKV